MPRPELEPVWKENFHIRSFDIDFNAKLRISSLCGFFQEIAGKHAEHLGVGYFSMQETGMVWMLSGLHIKIHEYPVWEDDISIETWPMGMERLFYRRDFHVFKKKQMMVSAVSFWLSLDIKSLRPRVFPIDENVIKSNYGRFALEGSLGSIPSPQGGIITSRDIRFSELDQNKHVNNTRYVEWIMDQFEISKLEKSMPRFFGIEYKHEVKEHDVVRIQHAPDPSNENTILLEGIVAASDHVCFRSRVVF